MKKLDFFRYAAILAAGILLFAACSNDNDNGGKSGEDNTNPNPVTFPTEPPVVSGGELTKGGNGENLAVTQANLPDFIDVLGKALNSRGARGQRALPEEYEIVTASGKDSRTQYGDYSGRVEITQDYSFEWKETATDETEKGYERGSYKFFDFSNHDSLFLGKAFGYIMYGDDKEGITGKTNGTIDFAGKYKGKIVFENAVIVNNTIKNTLKSGRFYIESGGGQIISPYSLLSILFDVYSENSGDYPDGQITIKMPDVPSVTGGNLTERSGNSVNSANVNDFFDAFIQEIYYYDYENASRAVNEEKIYNEELIHGKKSGYYTQKTNLNWQYNNSESYESGTVEVEYYDCSNIGVLYFGGGFGLAYYENHRISTTETIINGKMKFNGEFKGELVFENLKSERGNQISGRRHISGSVKIGSLDVTDKYLNMAHSYSQW